MSKTPELKDIIYSLLIQSQGEAYYEIASDQAVYPYKVFTFDNMNLGNSGRDDIMLVVDVWNKETGTGAASTEADSMCDKIEKDLHLTNAPNGTSFPTFYRDSRITVPDEDKSLKHKQMKFLIQNYYIG